MSWSELVLGDSLELLIDNRGKNPPYVKAGIPAISGMSVGDGEIVYSNARFVDEQTWSKWMPVPTQPFDIVMTSEAPLGRVALIRDDAPLALTQRVFGFRGRRGVLDNRFLYYALQTTRVRADLSGRATGTTVLGIRQPALRQVRIPAPGFEEQRAIADLLGALDDKIAANTKLAATAVELASVEYDRSAARVGVVPMSTVLTPVLGGTPSRSRDEYWGGDHLWISAKDVTGAPNSVVLDTEETITGLAVASTKAKPLRAGSVILTARGTVGAVARLAEPASFNQSCYGFEPDGVPPSILYFGVLGAAERAKSIAHGSVFDTITMKTFDHLQFPSFSEVDAARLDDVLAPLLAVVESAIRENRALATTRDALLPQLMSGKLRVRDAERQVEAEL